MLKLLKSKSGTLLSYLTFVYFFGGCKQQNTAEENFLLKEAAIYHDQALEKSKQAKLVLHTLEKRLQTLENIETTIILEQELKKYRQELLEWEENIIEVPGHQHMEHKHHHAHGHATNIELVPQQHMEVQKEYLSTVENILLILDSLSLVFDKPLTTN